MSASAIDEKAQEYYRKYVVGSGPYKDNGEIDTESSLYIAPKLVGFVDGEPVILTFATCRAVTAIVLAQTEGREDERYTFEEIAMWCVSDHLGMQIGQAANWVAPEIPKPGEELPNPTGGSQPQSHLSVSNGSSSTQE